MTKSEQICNEIGSKFFCKDFVYENLKYYNDKNQRVELCDALFEYASIYVPLQVKERSNKKICKAEEMWLEDVVYDEAFNQIKATILAIRTNNISVNDLYHQKVELDKDYLIFPIIVFENQLIKSYRRIIVDGNLTINIFSLEDFQSMMAAIIHPYDIIYYLQERAKWNGNNFPNIVLGEGDNISIVSTINSEYDFSTFFKQFIYDGKKACQQQALRHLGLIETFRNRQLKRHPDYKKIVKILQLIEPKIAHEFMSRFDYAWNCACENRFDYTKAIQIKFDRKSTSIVFFSVGRKELTSKSFYQILCDAKQLQHHSDAVLLISFIGDDKNHCRNDWIYWEKELVQDENILNFYSEIGMFNGLMNYNLYEKLCKKLLNTMDV